MFTVDSDMTRSILEKDMYRGRKTNRLDMYGAAPASFVNKINEPFDGEILLRSIPTVLASELSIRMGLESSLDKGHPDYREFTLEVNVKEYKLTNEQKAQLLQLLQLTFPAAIDIKIIAVAVPELTVKFLKGSRYTNIYLHEFNRWVKNHLQTLSSNPMPITTMTVPIDIIDKEGLTVSMSKIGTSMRISFSKHLDLEPIPLMDVSIPTKT